MCAVLRYSAGGLAAVLAMAYVAVSAETGLSAFQPAVAAPPEAQTVVNRASKGDREVTIRNTRGPSATQSKPTAARERKILEGCDPAFSPLTASAKNNFANRCMV